MRLQSEIANVLDGSLGKITTSKHPIYLHPDSSPAFQHSYPAELKKTDKLVGRLDCMLKEGVNEPTML